MSEPNLDRWADEQVKRWRRGNVWAGLGFTLVLHLMQVPIFFIVLWLPGFDDYAAFMPLIYLGLSQLIYMVPAILIARGRGHTETAKGLIIGTALTFLLNAACTGLFLLG